MAILCTKSLFEQLHNREAREQQESWCAHATSWLKVPGHASAVSVLWRCSPQTASGPVTGACAHHMGDYLFLAGYELICEPCPFSDNRGEKNVLPFLQSVLPSEQPFWPGDSSGESFYGLCQPPCTLSGQRCNSAKDCARAAQGLARAGRGPSSASCPLIYLAQTRIFSRGLIVGLLGLLSDCRFA